MSGEAARRAFINARQRRHVARESFASVFRPRPDRTLLMVAAVRILVEKHPAAQLLQLAWRQGGTCPWRLHHRLDDDWRPVAGDGDERRPKHPERLQALVMGFGVVAYEQDARLAGVRQGR